tara:strand:- start:1504 stop:1707 length:204 start_codon:yes stop_codon:yes gene_type:complete
MEKPVGQESIGVFASWLQLIVLMTFRANHPIQCKFMALIRDRISVLDAARLVLSILSQLRRKFRDRF